MAKRTKAEALKTRQELIETAIAQFAQHGVSKTTLNDIADAANVTRGAIYWHFENKTQLFNEMWLQQPSLRELIQEHLTLMNPLMILVKIIKLRWIHILSYDQMVSRKINNQTTRCANSIFYTTLFTNSAPNYT